MIFLNGRLKIFYARMKIKSSLLYKIYFQVQVQKYILGNAVENIFYNFFLLYLKLL